MSKDKKAPPGHVYVPGRGLVEISQYVMKSYYYRITIPQDINAGATIGLFCGHIGEAEWTNFTRERMFPVGHSTILYKVSLAVKPNRDTKVFDVIEALQLGQLTIRTGANEFLSEPLSFFPVSIYGETASREKDPLARLGLEIRLCTSENMEEARRVMWLISGIEIPLSVGESQTIDGDVDLHKDLFGSPKFGLYIVLHTITQKPLR